MTNRFSPEDFRRQYVGSGIAYPGVSNAEEAPPGWPYMSMDEAADLSAKYANRFAPLPSWPDVAINVLTTMLAAAVILMIATLVQWWWPNIPFPFYAAFGLALTAIVGLVAVPIWSSKS